jgi:hypothetical protein
VKGRLHFRFNFDRNELEVMAPTTTRVQAVKVIVQKRALIGETKIYLEPG